ncbi:uncharacterized protein TRIADDRAFT_58663 [Trichoplax adhaerens]|uniref:TGF-beta family profile domain-containing protein n=1 Tax=Trichoplax adhaerens TaxID=10228 RepID=B3S3B9_TRIAD|nr:hypothetical protein TRIADDRAFT_58663 [Trichoplax adhaerens]EDV22765.1 hypothetical protein TRIADDRAFT_58663 [Trichoplax adhaerens]|eukprot:XP_002114631.1 hypothetical protein TRIADDRAFT_58663 [Trichoplax adhaerens]
MGTVVRKNEFQFNISDINDKEELISAELRVFRLRHYIKLPHGHRGYYNAKVFQIMPRGFKDRLIDSQVIGHRSHGWKVFSVSPAVRYWIHYPKHNLGLRIVITELNSEEPLHQDLYQFAKHPPHHRSKQALLIVSSNVQLPKLANLAEVMKTVEGKKLHYKASENNQNSNQLEEDHPSRSKRSVNKRRDTNGRGYLPQDYSNSPCHREDLVVDFKDIGWEWIISPRSFNAYQCVGVCKYPLGSNTNATLHATLRAMMSYFGQNSQPTLPCCTPDRLRSHTFLFYNANHEIQINEFDGMVVETCGCH